MTRKILFVIFLTAVAAAALPALLAAHCPSDLNGDDIVDGVDLAILLGCWGCPVGGVCVFADFDHNGCVDGADLAKLLGSWGACPQQ